MLDRLRYPFTARADRTRDAEIGRLTACLEAERRAHANTLAERAPSATVLDQLDTAKQLAADRARRIEWLELETTRLRNRITVLEAQPTDLPTDTRELYDRTITAETLAETEAA